MAEHKVFNYSYASFTNVQRPLQKEVLLLNLYELVILDLVGGS